MENGAGEASSEWSTVTTLEAPPTGLATPTLTARGAFSIEVQWTPPTNPNGVITGEFHKNVFALLCCHHLTCCPPSLLYPQSFDCLDES